MASERKSSSSRSPSVAAKQTTERSARSKVAGSAHTLRSPASGHFAICVRNDDYPASLELRKLYPVLDDEFAAEHGMVRVIDESGEDYLFPSEYFVRVSLPQALEKQLLKIA